MFHKIGKDWLENTFKPQIVGLYEIKEISESDGDFGSLEGIQFDNSAKGGYIYFWEKGLMDFHLFEYRTNEEIVPTTMVEAKTLQDIQKNLKDLIKLI